MVRFVGSQRDSSDDLNKTLSSMLEDRKNANKLKIESEQKKEERAQSLIDKISEKGGIIDKLQNNSLSASERIMLAQNELSSLTRDAQSQEDLDKLKLEAVKQGVDINNIDKSQEVSPTQKEQDVGMSLINRNAPINNPDLPQAVNPKQLTSRDRILSAIASQSNLKREEEKNVKDINLANDFRKDFEKSPVVKNYAVISENVNKIDAALNHALAAKDSKSKAAADQVLVVALNKILDPTSVVRESEYARTAEGQSALSAMEGYLQRLKQGGAGLTDENRKDIAVVGHKLLNAGAKNYNEVYDTYNSYASIYGFKPEYIFGNLQRASQGSVDSSSITMQQRSQYNKLRSEGLSSEEARQKVGF